MTQASQTVRNNSVLTRRQFLAIGWTLAGLIAAGEASAATLSFMYPHLEAGSFGGRVSIGSLQDILKNLPNANARPDETFKNLGRFYLSRTEDGILALYRKCVHLGCVVPWNEVEDRFHCPCHGSQYDRKGEVLVSPAPRPLDYFLISEENGSLSVDTSHPIKRTHYDPAQAFPLKA
jgi:cytochrome b6-f complex iron-sulfur subunit